MSKILFVAAHRPNRSPSQRYRFEQYFQVLKNAGHTYHLAYLINEKDDAHFYNSGNLLRKGFIFLKSFIKRWKHTLDAKHYDYIFIQREAFMTGTTLFERRFKRTGKPIIFDFDDAIWKMDVSDGNKRLAWLKNPGKTADIIALADKVVAGNAYLKDYAIHHNANVTIIPTTIDTNIHFPKPELRDKSFINIGWSGSNTTIKHFRDLEPVLYQLKEKYGDKIQFTVYGSEFYSNAKLGIQGVKWTAESEVDIINSFDIGLMPLPNDEWSKGKCGLKGLSYMACEVATIMSAVGVNSEIIMQNANGLLANNHEVWMAAISDLIDNKERRLEIAKAGRKTVEDHYSTQSQEKLFLDLFKS
jgi:glycosyltransferase involved in cell wall biosynthesis